MKLWLQLYENEPAMLYTKTPDDKSAKTREVRYEIREVEYDGDCPPPKSLFVVYRYPRYHMFEELVEAVHFVQEEDVPSRTVGRRVPGPRRDIGREPHHDAHQVHCQP